MNSEGYGQVSTLTPAAEATKASLRGHSNWCECAVGGIAGGAATRRRQGGGGGAVKSCSPACSGRGFGWQLPVSRPLNAHGRGARGGAHRPNLPSTKVSWPARGQGPPLTPRTGAPAAALLAECPGMGKRGSKPNSPIVGQGHQGPLLLVFLGSRNAADALQGGGEGAGCVDRTHLPTRDTAASLRQSALHVSCTHQDA